MAALSSPVRPPAGASKRRRKAHAVFAGITLPVGSPKLPTPLSGVALPRRFRVAPSWSGGSSEPSERLPWHATRAFCTRSSGRLRTPCRFLTMVCPATIRKKTRSSAAPPFIPRNRIPKRLGTLPHANPATRPPRTCAQGATPSLEWLLYSAGSPTGVGLPREYVGGASITHLGVVCTCSIPILSVHEAPNLRPVPARPAGEL